MKNKKMNKVKIKVLIRLVPIWGVAYQVLILDQKIDFE